MTDTAGQAAAAAAAAKEQAASATSAGLDAVKGALPQILELIKEYLPMVISLATSLVYLGAFGAAIYFGYKTALNYWIEAKPNEWLLVIRNGELKKCSIGLCTWLMPGDQYVTFPSLLNKVNFNAN